MTRLLTQPLGQQKWLLFLPLCPSTNARMQPMCMRQLHEYRSRHGRFGKMHRMRKVPPCKGIEILSSKARTYINNVGGDLRRWAKKVKYKPIDNYRTIELWFILPRRSCDGHNYGKILFDALEEGGIVTNDRYLLPLYRGVYHDTKAPMVAILL